MRSVGIGRICPPVLLGVVAALVLACVSACTPSGPESRIVVTTDILGDIVSQVVGDEADVTVLMKRNADPHSFGVSARDAHRMRSADLIVYNGLGLEGGVLHHVEAAAGDGVPALAVGEGIDPLIYRDGDTAGSPDPHFWTDPRRVQSAVGLIADAVVAGVDGVDAEVVRASAADYTGRLARLDEQLAEAFAALPEHRRRLVTDHHVFGYLAERYGLEVIGAVIPSGTTLASPSASDLASLAAAIERAAVPAIFVDTAQPDRLASALATEAGLAVRIVPLYSESLGEPGGEAGTYLDLMRVNTTRILTALRG